MVLCNCHHDVQLTRTNSIFCYSVVVWFSTFFIEDVTSFDFVIFAFVVVVAFIIVSNHHSGMDRYVVIHLGVLVCLGRRMVSRGWRVLGGVSGCRCGRRWREGTGYIVWLIRNRRQLRSVLNPPLIGTVSTNLKRKKKASLWIMK